MLFLIFHLGTDRYALEASRVEEVLPFVEIQRLPQSPHGIAGVFNYRGHLVPALDLCDLILQRPAREQLSTRIVVINCPGGGSETHWLGLIAEQATDLLRRDRQDFVNAGAQTPDAAYLGPVTTDAQGLIRWLREDRLLPDNMRESLFAQALFAPVKALTNRTTNWSGPA